MGLRNERTMWSKERKNNGIKEWKKNMIEGKFKKNSWKFFLILLNFCDTERNEKTMERRKNVIEGTKKIMGLKNERTMGTMEWKKNVIKGTKEQ